MVYPEGKMAETHGISEGTTQQEDPRVIELTDELYGALMATLPDQPPDKATSANLRSLAHQWAKRQVTLENENNNLQQLVDRDPYNPEIYSANGWYRVMKDKLAELKRNKQNAAVLAIDLDDFKRYNDATRSHLKGDEALGLAGQLMKNVLRPTDIVARLHGDEYVIVASGANMDAGVIIAERVRQAIPQMSALLETSVPFSASIGVVNLSEEVIQTRYDSDEQLVATLKQAYGLADRAQYGAKQAGKNRIGVMLPDGKIQTAIVDTNTKGQTPTITYQES